MHVVILGDYPQNPARLSGGVEAVVLYLVQRLQSYPDLKVEVITLGPRGSQRRTVQYDQVPVHYLPRVRWPSRLSILGNIYQMRAEVLRLKPDLVHAQIAGEYAEAALKSGLPWLLTLHGIRFLEAELWSGWLSRYYRGWFIKREEFQAVRKAKHLISISPFIQEVFQRQIKGQVYTIENPIADDFFQLHHCEKPYQLLFIGRLIPRKGVHTLLQAFAQLHQRMPEARLRLAGGPAPANESDQYYPELKQFVLDSGLEEAVTFLGELDKSSVLQEYAACSALVLSSVLETAPMVVMQAMAAGKAVVTTDAGGARHLIEHGQMGLVVPPNEPDQLADALYEILSDHDRRREMGRSAREAAKQRFHVDVVAQQTRTIYHQILS